MKKSLFAFFTACFLVACSDNSTVSESKEIQSQPSEQTTYRVYGEQNYVPFIMHTTATQISGFEYDLLQAIAKKQNFQLTFTAHTWDDLFATLERGDADILGSALTITPERQKSMDFTQSYLETEPVLLTKNKQIRYFGDMIGRSVTVQKGTIHQQLVEQVQKGNGELFRTETMWLAVNDVLRNQADATLGDSAVLNYYVKQYPNENLMIIKDMNATKEQLGFAVKKGNQALLNELNQGLAKIKTDGTYEQIYQKWFGKQ